MRSVKKLGAVTLGVVLTTLLARADAPEGLYGVGTDTILDSRTRLQWERRASAPPELFTFDEATTRCAGLTTGGFSWRVPTVKELQSLVDEGQSDPVHGYIASPPFAVTGAARLDSMWWTSTPVVGQTGKHWAVSFGHGASGINPVGTVPCNDVTYMLEVRCVLGPVP